MITFIYEAINIDGKSQKGKLEAKNKQNAQMILKERNLTPIVLKEESILHKEIFITSPVKAKDLAIFCRQFNAILAAGINILEALYLLKEQTANKHLAMAIDDMYNSIEKGELLSGAMKKHHKIFPDLLVNMVAAGEATGNLDVVMNRMAEHFEKETKTKQSITKATTYPLIVTIVMIVVVSILIIFVVPTFVGIFAELGMDLPLTTRLLIAISNFVVKRWYLILVVLLLIFGGFTAYKTTPRGRKQLGKLKLKIPVFGPLQKKIATARFSRTMATMLASGLPLIDALEIVSKTLENDYLEEAIMSVRDQTLVGRPLSTPIKELEIFPPMLHHMIRIGEDTGAIEDMMDKVADFFEDEVDMAVSQLTTILEPMIIVILALVVGFVVLAVIQPMFGMYEGLGNL